MLGLQPFCVLLLLDSVCWAGALTGSAAALHGTVLTLATGHTLHPNTAPQFHTGATSSNHRLSLRAAPQIARKFAVASETTARGDAFMFPMLVQSTQHLTEPVRAALAMRLPGLAALELVPPGGLFCLGTMDTVDALLQEQAVLWAGPYLPEYKWESSLWSTFNGSLAQVTTGARSQYDFHRLLVSVVLGMEVSSSVRAGGVLKAASALAAEFVAELRPHHPNVEVVVRHSAAPFGMLEVDCGELCDQRSLEYMAVHLQVSVC